MIQNKNIEEYNMLRLSLEGGIEELERRIEHTHQVKLQQHDLLHWFSNRLMTELGRLVELSEL